MGGSMHHIESETIEIHERVSFARRMQTIRLTLKRWNEKVADSVPEFP